MILNKEPSGPVLDMLRAEAELHEEAARHTEGEQQAFHELAAEALRSELSRWRQ